MESACQPGGRVMLETGLLKSSCTMISTALLAHDSAALVAQARSICHRRLHMSGRARERAGSLKQLKSVIVMAVYT